jgi:hypothetical protein
MGNSVTSYIKWLLCFSVSVVLHSVFVTRRIQYSYFLFPTTDMFLFQSNKSSSSINDDDDNSKNNNNNNGSLMCIHYQRG